MSLLADTVSGSRLNAPRFQILSASLFINLLALALPLAVLQVYDRILPNQSLGTTTLLAIGVGCALVLEVLLRMARSHVLGRLGCQFEHKVGTVAVQKMLGADLAAFEQNGAGVHLERYNALNTVKDHYSGQAILALYDMPFCIIYMLLVGYIGGPLVIIPLLAFLIFVTTLVATGPSIKALFSKMSQAENERFNFMISVLRGMASVKAMAMEMLLLRRYEKLQAERLSCNREIDVRIQSLSEASVTLNQLAGMAIVGFGSMLVLNGQMTIGGLSACMLLVGRALQPLQGLASFWSRIQSVHVARRQLRKVFELPQRSVPVSPRDAGTTQGFLKLQDVHFSFSGDKGSHVLDGINLEIQRGEIVALIGPNGGGKSALLSVMAGLYQPTSGSVLLDDIPLREFDPVSVRRNIAYLSQQETLFRGTILDNITMFRPELANKAMQAADLIGIGTIVRAMPLGFNTIVGEGLTESLPRGLSQRIAIARALVNRPKLILFDDANSAVDDLGDAGLKSSMKEIAKESGVLIVSHRPAMLKLADKIYRMDNGKVDRGFVPQALEIVR